MTREQFREIVKIMRGAYSTCPIVSQSIFDLWYDAMSDMDADIVLGYLRKHIQRNRFPPTIAELRGESEGKDFNNFARRKYNMDELESQLLQVDKYKGD